MTARVLGSSGAELTAVYVPAEGDGDLQLAEAVGGSGAPYGLPERCALSGDSPVATAFRTGLAQWLGPDAFAAQGSVGVLPLGDDTKRLGCLVIVDKGADAFGADRRSLLELHADQVAAGLEAVAARVIGRTGSPVARRPEGRALLGPGLDTLRGGAFTLGLSTGQMDTDAQVLELFGIAPQEFDGRVETLLARTVPDDVPALMAIVEPGRVSAGSQQLSFRIRRPNGELRWLSLRCRVLAGADGAPDRMLGVVADAAYLRPSADEVAMVQRLSAALAAATTIRDVSKVVAAALRAPLGAARVAVAEIEADRFVVTVLDPPEPDAWPSAWRSEWRSEWPDASCHQLPTLEAALRAGQVALWPPGATLEPALEGVAPGGLAVLPLPAEGRMVGVCLVGWDEEHRFGPEERSLLTATAGLAGQALVRAHALDARHELTTMLQRSLLPRKLPRLAGGVAAARYLPATVGLDVGGDWFDVIPLSDGHVALVIGDVQGHSAGAATIMGQMRTAIRAYAVEGHPPDVVVAHTNRLLVGMETDLFATCCYVDLDMEEGIAWFVRAGHLPPLLRYPDGSTEEMGIEGGPPLGVIADGEFPLTEVGLAPGTVLALLTDGLAESASLPLEDGLRKAREALGAADPADVGRVAEELIGSAERRDDDVAVLVLRYDGMRSRPTRARWTVWRLPDAVMHARRFTARTLRSWQVTQEMDVALLVVSELVTNAIAHTQGEVRLDLTLAADRLRIAVNDASPRAPVKPVSVDWEATGGRGLLLVEAMSVSWGSVPLSGGKQVWSEVALSPRERLSCGDTEEAG
ncbi:SpoIIE family protein phosphatase [Streptomyces sp. NPDC101150]|uniref:SpoIIE family protein phosphatase n=1 Tax=Streptomyces sp. NPDC101150 TaxID=3366114 RepID=UPI0037F8600C